ncbi:MAG: ATP-binding protein [Phycisphaerales bacterium]|nr:MAG: ATP-binding protein [Phycisphaerales bacterium]
MSKTTHTSHSGNEPADAGRVELPNERDAIDALQRAVLAAVERHAYPKASAFAVRLAIEEAVTNAFRHGHQGLSSDETVLVEYEVGRDAVRIEVEDRGPGFDPGDVPDPTLDENLEVPSGRGLMLIRAYMTETSHNERGNRLIMRYARPAPDA